MKTTTKSTKTAKTIKAKNQDELNELMAKQCSFSEAVKGVKDELKRIYPEDVFLCFSAEHGENGKAGMASVNHFGNEDLTRQLITLLMTRDSFVLDTIQKAWLGWILIQDPKNKSEAFIRVFNAVIDYAKSKGLDTSDIHYIDERQKPEYEIGQNLKKADNLEMYLTILEKEQQRVKSYMNPANRITLLNAEIKRLRRAGDMAMVAHKTVELNSILDAEKERKEKEKRKAENLAKKREAARKATAAWVEKCRLKREEKEEAARKAEQAELDRQQGYKQFQPGKAAKKKMQKIAERQAERNARKKKGKEGDSFRTVKNACSLGR